MSTDLIEEKSKSGRPKADIDWDLVNTLLTKGCSGAEISGYFGLNKCTIYERCLQDNGIPFSEYSIQFYSKGEAMLRAQQFDRAMGTNKDGDNVMLVWLGKNRLKQSDSPVQDQIQEQALGKYDAMMKQLESLQELSSARKISENNNITESKS